MMRTILVFGDQLNREIGALADAQPSETRVLMVESRSKLSAQQWHVQRAHFYLASMHRFADDLRRQGFDVHFRRAESFTSAVQQHRSEFRGDDIVATEPNSWAARQLLQRLDIPTVRSNQFLCHHADFAGWVDSRLSAGYKTFKMEDFYRRQRLQLGYLMDGSEPATGKWNYDSDNRQPPPKSDHDRWAVPLVDPLDQVDDAVLASLPDTCIGSLPSGTWSTSREGALRRLRHFVDDLLPVFGPHEDAMLTDNWHLAHSLLSPYLNNGLLLPTEVCDAVQAAYDAGRVDIASAEGFIRQIIGWREYVWGLYWMSMPGYRDENALGASLSLPPLFSGGSTRMNCVAQTLRSVENYSWAHHIQRLMVLGNFALTSGVQPQEFTAWMSRVFIDAAEWVMVPNVIGMALYADGGRMATKPYASGGAYIDKMSDYCKGCAYDRKKRTGDDACPFTTLYWDFLLRHADIFGRNPRIVTQVRAAQKLADKDAVQLRANEVRTALSAGTL
jgi:deoxyribodipyrimidine photolyase-related protein